jgi:hypothetical protein
MYLFIIWGYIMSKTKLWEPLKISFLTPTNSPSNKGENRRGGKKTDFYLCCEPKGMSLK